MDDLTPIDKKAPSVEEAITKGLRELGLTRNDVIVEIVDEGSPGILGVGSREAHIRLTPLRAPRIVSRKAPTAEEPQPEPEPEPEPVEEETPEPEAQAPQPEPVEEETPEPQPLPDNLDEEAQLAHEALTTMLGIMDFDAELFFELAEPHEIDSPWLVDIRGEDLGALIGRKGSTLSSLQYLTRLIVSRELQRRVNLVVDVEGYKERRADSLRKLAERMARQATKMGRTVTLEPMPPNERRIIHMALRDNHSVTTESVGRGKRRRVTIVPN